MKSARTGVALGVVAHLVFMTAGLALRAQQTDIWAPKPGKLPGYAAPQRPHVKVSELKARHARDREWRELLVDDGHLQAEHIRSAPGAIVSKRFHPDSRAWWVAVDGQVRGPIEGTAPSRATH